ncbi:hypothetical protein BH11PLA2_BH11PLA2_43210 [soil metagenome]
MELQLEFTTDRFKLTGPLPDDNNAGNQFYGEDLAKWLCETLPAWKLDHMDEDWGWLVFTTKDYMPADQRHSICVYAYPAENQGASDHGHWMLSILCEYKVKWLGLLKRWKHGPYHSDLAKEVIAGLESLGIQDVKQTEIN